jgi:ACS family hexuronate transporter-like MFS transporter
MYIEQDNEHVEDVAEKVDSDEPKIGFLKCFTFPQTWSFFVGKFMTDGVWWFFLFWTPAYISDVYGYSSDSTMGMILIFVLYAITMLSLYGGKLPTIIINKTGKNPYAARMQAMLIFAFIPLVGLVAQPLGQYSCWLPIIIIGIIGAAHQSWSANIFSTIGDMFPKSIIATITGIGGMAGGIGSFIINKGAGSLFSYSAGTCLHNGVEVEMSTKLLKEIAPNLNADVVRECALNGQELANQLVLAGCEIVQTPMEALGFIGKPAGYMIVFCFCAVAYLIGWVIMKTLVPKYKPIVIEK